MVDRVIAVRLKIEIDEARRNAKAAADAFRGIADSAEQAGKADQSLSRLGAAAKGAGKAVATIGGVAVGGMAALTVGVVKGGIAYNTLEQTSRAALKTVLGSASAASSQMEKLREFGKSSPFPRQVWIAGQQQLLAFGMSAEKIIPTFKAIQDAVAAAGGGSQQITEVVDVLAKVQSTGKVTAETLNELGYRGIDAATLVGTAMHKTAAEVRDDIQSQAISGTQFIDLLTGAMEKRFGGAAANVKKTWEGAKDRIKGAVRDIGSVLATPLVDPNGGGAAVEWANALADALRALEARLTPIMQAMGDRAAPILSTFTQKLKDLANWIKTADFSKIGDQIHNMLPAIAGLTAGFATMGARSLPIIGNLVGGLKPLPVALASAALASPALRQALLDLLTAAEPLIKILAQASTTMAGALSPALTALAAVLQPVIAVVQVLGNVLGVLPAPIQAVIGGLLLFKGLQMTGMLSGITAAFKNFGSEMQAQKSYAAMAGQSIGSVNAAYSVAAAGVSRAAVGVKGALASVTGFLTGPWGIALALGATLLAAFAGSTGNSTEKQTGLIDALEAGTGAITDQTRAFVQNKFETSGVSDIYRGLGGNARDLTDAYLGNDDALKRVRSTLSDAAAHAGGTDKAKFQALLKVFDAAPTVLRDAAQAARDKGTADKDGAASADANANAQTGLAGALSATGAAATDAAAQMQAMNADLQNLYAAQFGLSEAQDKFSSGLNGLSALFDGNHTATAKAAKSTDKYSDSLKRQAKIVADTKKQLQDLAESEKQAEKEAANAAKEAKQRALDALFGKQFDVSSTVDAFRSSLAQAGTDVAQARKDKTVGATSLTGFSVGALENRDRLRGLVQQAQAAIQAEKDSGASKERISTVTRNLNAQLAAQAHAWGLSTAEVKLYTNAIAAFGGLTNQVVHPNLEAVRRDFAAQRKEIVANSREQLDNAKASGVSSAASGASATATKIHTAALVGNSESAIENREKFRQQVKAAQDALVQYKLNGAGTEEMTRRGRELSGQLEKEAIRLGFNKRDVRLYTDAIKDSAVVINHYPTLNVKALTAGALTTIKNFVNGVNAQMKKIQKNFSIGVRTGSEYVNTMGGGHIFAAQGGYISGPGGPREDKVPAWLSNGEFVINARDTKRHRPLLESINSGSAKGYAQGGHVDPVNLRYKGIYRPKALNNFFKLINRDLAPFFGGGAGGAIGSGGAGVQRWAPLVLEVLKLLHQPAGLLPHVLRRMNQESGGNPRAINLTDINAQRGDPSKGLMQTISGTFNAYAGPFRNRGIYDPLANIYAGLNYALHRYGSIQAAMDKAGGYAHGGLVEGIKSFKEFGKVKGSYERGTDYVPMTGLYRLHRGERVTPASRNHGGDFTVTIRGDGSKFSDLVIDSFQKAQGTNRINLVRR